MNAATRHVVHEITLVLDPSFSLFAADSFPVTCFAYSYSRGLNSERRISPHKFNPITNYRGYETDAAREISLSLWFGGRC